MARQPAPATRFPGPYVVGADARSIDLISTNAAVWMREIVGPHQRVAADRVNRLLMGSHGEADVVFHGSSGVDTWQIFWAHFMDADAVARIRAGRIGFLVVDRRLSSALPLVPFYYEEGEIFGGRHTAPIPPERLAKWDTNPLVDRLYDAGPVQILDVRRYLDVP